MSYNDALKLEVSILEALLQRNRCSHSKAKYFQRSSMVLRAICRANVLDLSPAVETWKTAVLERKEQITSSKSSSINSKRQRETEMWDLASIQQESKNSNQSLLDAESVDMLKSIKRTIQTSVPEVVSRIEFASQPLLLEISRGFFLPFCTIALAALGRIRVLLMRLGHHALDEMQDVHQTVMASTSKDADVYSSVGLTAKEIVALRTQFTETDQHLPTPLAYQEKLRKLRQSLGINDGKNSANELNDDHDIDQDTLDSSSDTMEGMKNRLDYKKRSKQDPSIDDNDDVGESVLCCAPEESPFASTSDRVEHKLHSHPAIAPRSTSKTTSPEPTRATSKKEKKAKQLRKEQRLPDGPAAKKRSSSPMESTGKKEKKKKRKKQDFFDNLFD